MCLFAAVFDVIPGVEHIQQIGNLFATCTFEQIKFLSM